MKTYVLAYWNGGQDNYEKFDASTFEAGRRKALKWLRTNHPAVLEREEWNFSLFMP